MSLQFNEVTIPVYVQSFEIGNPCYGPTLDASLDYILVTSAASNWKRVMRFFIAELILLETQHNASSEARC